MAMTGKEFTFGEAFMLMKYASKCGTVIEWLWNSRDGVLPFMIGPPAGAVPISGDGMLMHADWHEDARAPNFVPPIGMRIFVDLTLDKALAFRREYVERYWADAAYPIKDHDMLGPLGKEGAAEHLAEADVGDGKQPTVAVVDEALRKHFAKLALSRYEPPRPPRPTAMREPPRHG